MGRQLTSNERNKINQICKTEIGMAAMYCNFAKIIAPIFTISVFLFLYFEIAWGSIWIYLGIGILISIIEISGLEYVQTPYFAIKDNNCKCFESKMISSRKALIVDSQNLIPRSVLEKLVLPGEVRHYNYYVRVNIDGEVKDVEYKGKEFNYLSIGEQMLIIQYENGKKEKKYLCFSNKEINA